MKRPERTPLRAIRVRERSDGTTLLRFRRKRSLLLLCFCWIWTTLTLLAMVTFLHVLFADELANASAHDIGGILLALLTGILSASVAVGHFLTAERIVIRPAGLTRRSGLLRRTDLALLDDISTVMMTGDALPCKY